MKQFLLIDPQQKERFSGLVALVAIIMYHYVRMITYVRIMCVHILASWSSAALYAKHPAPRAQNGQLGRTASVAQMSYSLEGAQLFGAT